MRQGTVHKIYDRKFGTATVYTAPDSSAHWAPIHQVTLSPDRRNPVSTSVPFFTQEGREALASCASLEDLERLIGSSTKARADYFERKVCEAEKIGRVEIVTDPATFLPVLTNKNIERIKFLLTGILNKVPISRGRDLEYLLHTPFGRSVWVLEAICNEAAITLSSTMRSTDAKHASTAITTIKAFLKHAVVSPDFNCVATRQDAMLTDHEIDNSLTGRGVLQPSYRMLRDCSHVGTAQESVTNLMNACAAGNVNAEKALYYLTFMKRDGLLILKQVVAEAPNGFYSNASNFRSLLGLYDCHGALLLIPEFAKIVLPYCLERANAGNESTYATMNIVLPIGDTTAWDQVCSNLHNLIEGRTAQSLKAKLFFKFGPDLSQQIEDELLSKIESPSISDGRMFADKILSRSLLAELFFDASEAAKFALHDGFEKLMQWGGMSEENLRYLLSRNHGLEATIRFQDKEAMPNAIKFLTTTNRKDFEEIAALVRTSLRTSFRVLHPRYTAAVEHGLRYK